MADTELMMALRTAPWPVALTLAGLVASLPGQTVEAVPISEGTDQIAGVPSVPLVDGSSELWDLVFSRVRFDSRLPDQFALAVLDVLVANSANGSFGAVRSHASSGTPGQMGPGGAPPEVVSQAIFAPSPGALAMTPADDPLVWSGRVFAVPSSSDDSGELPIVGDVTVQVVGGADPTVNVSFSNLVSLADGSTRESFSWSDLALQDGAFGDGGPESGIRGLFLGDGQGEAGGMFQWQGLSGAFSASRGGVPGQGPGDGPEVEGGEIAALLDFVMSGPNLGFASGFVAGEPREMGDPPISGRSSAVDDRDSVPTDMVTTLQFVGYTDGMGRQSGRFSSTLSAGFGEGGEDNVLGLAGLGETRGFAVGDGYGAFGANATSIALPISALIPGSEDALPPDPFFETGVIASWGISTITQPSRGLATWRGDMVATDTSDSPTRGNQVQGDALVQIDLDAEPMVDVEFTRIRDTDAGLARGDMAWSGIPLVSGVFATDEGGFLRGSFVGERYEGVSGIFERDDLSGGFSATRVPTGQQDGPESPERVVHIVAAASTSAVSTMGERGLVAAVEELIASVSTPESAVGQVSEHSFSPVMIGKALTDIHAYAGWLDSGFFSVASIYPEGGGEQPRDAPIASVALLSGLASHSTPSNLSARWVGTVLATDGREGPAGGGILRGDALIALEQAAYVVANVRFSQITDSADGNPRSDMTWLGIPVIDGLFHSSTGQDWIRGHFLGADHSGVGGSFDWLGLRGVFGASQTSP